MFLSAGIEVSPFDEEDAKTAGELWATLQAAGTPIGPYDLMVAAALAPRSSPPMSRSSRAYQASNGRTGRQKREARRPAPRSMPGAGAQIEMSYFPALQGAHQ